MFNKYTYIYIIFIIYKIYENKRNIISRMLLESIRISMLISSLMIHYNNVTSECRDSCESSHSWLAQYKELEKIEEIYENVNVNVRNRQVSTSVCIRMKLWTFNRVKECFIVL